MLKYIDFLLWIIEREVVVKLWRKWAARRKNATNSTCTDVEIKHKADTTNTSTDTR